MSNERLIICRWYDFELEKCRQYHKFWTVMSLLCSWSKTCEIRLLSYLREKLSEVESVQREILRFWSRANLRYLSCLQLLLLVNLHLFPWFPHIFGAPWCRPGRSSGTMQQACQCFGRSCCIAADTHQKWRSARKLNPIISSLGIEWVSELE